MTMPILKFESSGGMKHITVIQNNVIQWKRNTSHTVVNCTVPPALLSFSVPSMASSMLSGEASPIM